MNTHVHDQMSQFAAIIFFNYRKHHIRDRSPAAAVNYTGVFFINLRRDLKPGKALFKGGLVAPVQGKFLVFKKPCTGQSIGACVYAPDLTSAAMVQLQHPQGL